MDSQAHPTDALRLQHFLASVDDYERLDRAMPLGRSINMLGHRDDDVRRWQVVLHALLLRKYFGGKHEEVRLKRVIESARECQVHGGPEGADWTAMIQNVERMEDGVGSRFGDDPRTYSDADLYFAEVYGRLLHGDFGKWQTTVMAGDRGTDTAVFSTAASRADRVITLARWLRQEREAGLLAF